MDSGNKKKRLEKDDIMVYMCIFGILTNIIVFILVVLLGDYILEIYDIAVIITIIATIIAIMGAIGIYIQKLDDRDNLIANMNLFQQEYDNYVNRMGIKKSSTQATLIELGKYDLHYSMRQYLWIDNEMLKIFPMSEDYKRLYVSSNSKPNVTEMELKSLSLDSILYFEEVGELRKYTRISGGGSSLKGALIGYALDGDVGAIIASREPIRTEIVSEDDRKVELIYKNQENEVENLEFEHDAYKVLKKLIPSKELRRIVALGIVEDENETIDTDVHNNQTIKEKLSQLNELKNEGLITDEEFSEQRKKILDTF